MNRKIHFSVSLLLTCGFLSGGAFAKEKPDRTVLYKNNKAYCHKGLQLFYSSGKDQYFCGRIQSPRTDNYVYVDANGRAYCKSPYTLAFTGRSTLFKSKPTCILIR